MGKSSNKSLKKGGTVRKKGGGGGFKRIKNKDLDFIQHYIKIHDPIKNIFS